MKYTKNHQHHVSIWDQSQREVLASDQSLSGSQIKLNFHKCVAELETDWRKLEDTSKCSPFQRLSWLKPLYGSLDANQSQQRYVIKEPFLVSGYQADKLVFVLPMMIEVDMFGKRLKWIGADVSDYNGMIVDSVFAARMSKDLFDRVIWRVAKFIPDLDAIYLNRNPVFDSTFDVISGSSENCWQGEHSSHTLNLSHNWKTLYAKIRSKKSRQRLRSKYRALMGAHKITFKQIRNLEKRLEAMEQILDWKTEQVNERGARNPFGSIVWPSPTRMVITSSVQNKCDTSIKVFGMYQDNQFVAGILAFIEGGKFYYLVSAYSPDIPTKFSIGTQLLLKTLELASRARLRQYDFLLGDEAYKLDWCDTNVPLMNRLIPLTLKGRVYGIGVNTVHVIKKLIVRSPLLTELTRRLIRASKAEVFQRPTEVSSLSPVTPNNIRKDQAEFSPLRPLTDSLVQKERV